MRCKACNSTLMTVCPLLLQLAAALSAHHECITVLLCAQLLLGAFSLASGVFLSISLRARVRRVEYYQHAVLVRLRSGSNGERLSRTSVLYSKLKE